MEPDLDDVKGYVGLDSADLLRLRALWPHVDGERQRIVDHFYERVLEYPETRRVLVDPRQVERLKGTLVQWMRELLCGPYDDAYRERRLRIGRRHVEVGLESPWLYTAAQVVADDLAAIAWEALPTDEARATVAAVHRALTVDLALITSSYVASRERMSAIALQDLLVQQLRVTVFLADHDGCVSAATRATIDLFGADGIVGRSWESVVPAELRQAADLDARVATALAHGRELSVPRVDATIGGVRKTFAVLVVPLDHPLARFLMQIEDLTEAVTLEGLLRRNEALAQLGSLSVAVAHELRNPLAGISGALQVIHRSIDPNAPYAPIMAKVDAEIRRLDGLVTDLLAFGRPTIAEFAEIDLADTARRTLDLIRVQFPEPRFTVQGEGRALADADLVHQILLNLLQNAAQALLEKPGAAEIEVRVGPGSLVVCDDGPGISPEVGKHVFEPFFTTKTRGTGLGLAVCQRFAEAMGGALALLPPPGPLGGAAFELRLRRV